jgi:recombination protein RecR
LIRALSRLPGIGEKTATRLAFFVLRAPADVAQELATALVDVKERIGLCSTCRNLTELDPCALCADGRRDGSIVCVVAQPPDLLAIERSGSFRGRYHVLHGVLSPLDGVGPDDLHLGELLGRIRASGTATPVAREPQSAYPSDQDPAPADAIREVIVATSPNVEGEATALYLSRVLKPLGVRVTRIASGVPMGGELEYVDQVTVSRALEARREM